MSDKTFEGACGIKATVLADSLAEGTTNRLTTFEIEVPRIIWSEFLTHRMFSRNAASSRAIPFAKMQEQLTGRPVRFGAANKGMQDKGEDFEGFVLGDDVEYEGNIGCSAYSPEEAWEEAKRDAIKWSERFYKAGYAKQVYNRICEPFQMIKGVISATEFDNWFWLRDDKAADPTIAELARVMLEAKNASVPQVLKAGEWHLPYVDWDFDSAYGSARNQLFWLDNAVDTASISTEQAIKVSAARSAAVSFRNNDYGLEKCLEVYERLVGDERKHSSALEHQATPMKTPTATYSNLNDGSVWRDGVSHMDKDGSMWSGNFRGFVQHRKTIAGENYIKP